MTSKQLKKNNLKTIPTVNSQIKLFHPGLKDLLLLEQYCNRKIGFLSIETPLPHWLKKFTQLLPSYALGLHLRREYRHLAMGIKALKTNNCDTFFVFEAYNQHLLLLLPLLSLTRKDIVIMLHGNQQFAIHNKLKYSGLLYLKLFLILFKRFKVILLELDDHLFPEYVRLPENSKIIMPHPLVEELTPSLPLGTRIPITDKIKIGIVGIIRADKPIGKLIATLLEFCQNNTEVELIIGTPIQQKPAYLDELDVQIYDTTQEADYFQTLREIDILIAYYDRDRYYYRTSGVISDGGSAGCYILASDYPIIKQQINYPVPIGETFTNFDELPSKITQAIAFIRTHGRDNHWLWREKRTAESIAQIVFPEG
ncbi:MAG: glycosyltransferase family 1 protein [Pleurocapsa sp.]